MNESRERLIESLCDIFHLSFSKDHSSMGGEYRNVLDKYPIYAGYEKRDIFYSILRIALADSEPSIIQVARALQLTEDCDD